jgi:hypothetical protein
MKYDGCKTSRNQEMISKTQRKLHPYLIHCGSQQAVDVWGRDEAVSCGEDIAELRAVPASNANESS